MVAKSLVKDERKLDELLSTLQDLSDLKTFRKLDFFKPYAKQREFFSQGSKYRERLLMAGNQLGKSEAGAFETACHLTGEYPAWWTGKRFKRPVKAWAAGETSLVVRNVSQLKLCGPPGVDSEFGSGFVPRDMFKDKPSLARGVTDAYDMIQVTHKTNGVVDGVSTLEFKSYEQGRKKFQGATLDFIWLDEEPDLEIYSEALTRVTATKGFVFMTFTPLLGMSDVVLRFLNEPDDNRSVVTMTIDDAEHIPEEEREKIIAGYPPHEREARVKGVPMLGSGRIFQVSESSIMEPAIENIPPHWAKIWGMDFGIGHPFAAVLLLWDRDTDTIHVHQTIRVEDQTPLQHAKAMKMIGAAVPAAWPQDGTQREKGSGDPLARLYKTEGVLMLPDHATHPDGSISTEAGVAEMDLYMKTGRFKVANHLSEWFEEFRLYHRKDGLIVKKKDDLMSATRVGMMMRRYARNVALGSQGRVRRREQIAEGVDFDLFA